MDGIGLLDNKYYTNIENVRIKYKEVYSIVYEFNCFGYEILEKSVGSHKQDELYIFTTFRLLHNSFQSAIILLEYGLIYDFFSVIRTMYDKYFDMCYVRKDINHLKFIYQNNIKDKLAILGDIKDNKFFDLVSEKQTNNLITELKSKALYDGEKMIKKKKTIEKVNECCLKKEYCHYRYLSGYIHNNLNNVEKIINQKEYGVEIDTGISYVGFLDNLSLLVNIYSKSLDLVCNILDDKKIKDKNTDICKRYDNIIGYYWNMYHKNDL